MLDSRKFKKIEIPIKTLANHRRLAVLSLLRNNKEMSVGDIAEELKISIQATSKHLKLLERAGILVSDQRSLLVYYSLDKNLDKFIMEIISLL